MVDDPHAPADPTASSSYSFSSSPPPFPTVPIAPSVPSVPVAPTHRLVKQPFNSIEFPGPISSSSPLSLQTALRTLGSQETIDSVFNRATKVLELRFRPDDEWSHPIIGESGGAQKLVLKITTRRRRNKRAIGNGAGGPRKNMNENNGKVTADNIDPGLFEQLQGPSNEDGDDGSTNTNVADADAEEEANGSALRAKEAAKESERQVAAGKGREQQGGVFKAEIVGALRQTVRFRAIADYQYSVDPEEKMVKLAKDLSEANPTAILDFTWSPLNETYYAPLPGLPASELARDDPISHTHSDATIRYKSLVNMLPPPLFSRQVIPHIFDFAANPTTKMMRYTDPDTGEAKSRLYNVGRLKTFGTVGIKWDDKEQVPMEPTRAVVEAAKDLDQNLIAELHEHFTERRAWTRMALLNQFPIATRKIIDSKRAHLPSVAYYWQDGPFRDTLFPFGFDPREDPSSYIYQKIYFRNVRDEGGVRPSTRRMIDSEFDGTTRGTKAYKEANMEKLNVARQSGERFEINEELGHIFDGVTLHRDIGNYQLIDIHDPLLSSMIHDERARKAQPDFLSGWFKLKQFNIIKAVLRRKWLALTDGTVCSDAECADLLEEFRDFENFQGTGVNMGMGGGQRFETEEPGENSEAGSSTPGPSMSRRKGRPRGGGGYAAGTVPGGTTVRAALPRQDRWKRKGVARLPLREEEQAARRITEAMQRQEESIRKGQKFREEDAVDE